MTDLSDYRKLHPAIADDFTVPENYERYTSAEHATWRTLFNRQIGIVKNRVVPAWFEGLDRLGLSPDEIPNFASLSEKLKAITGWTVVPVPGLVPDDIFFEHLANRRFPAGNFIRDPKELDYIEAPDVFHDVFGHVPMLTNPVFADYMQAYGKGGLRSMQFGALANLSRLYWYTVEFGLINTPEGLRFYGAGITSSKSESIFALEDPSPNRVGFDLIRLMRTRYEIDDFQETYFVIESFDQLFHATVDPDFAPYYAKLKGMSDIAIDALEPGDKIFTRGTQTRSRAVRKRDLARA